MIKIQRLPAPPELTPLVVAQKTKRYKADPEHKPVWKEPYIVSQLMRMSHNKCCYCECLLGEESKYMEVEHFHDKDNYPDEVVVWDNLLPSCKACNGRKHTRDTVREPIVNPSVDNPADYLAFRDYRYRGKERLGRETIEALNLNDTNKKCLPRFVVCNGLIQKLEECVTEVKAITLVSRPQEKDRFINKVIDILELCQCDQEYTAIKATCIANHPDYQTLVQAMKTRGLWIPELVRLDASMRRFMLDLV